MSNVYVWDKFVRLFHWSLVVLFVTSYLTGENESPLHIYSGYGIIGLVIARIVWGLVGKQHARFSDFVCSPATVIDYIKSVKNGNPKHYLGHNPLGGLMVIALLMTLLATTISGLKLYAVEEGKGPLAQNTTLSPVAQARADDDDDAYGEGNDHDEFWKEIHETGVNLMILLIVLHIVGVVVSSRLHRESLVKAMITGYKNKP